MFDFFAWFLLSLLFVSYIGYPVFISIVSFKNRKGEVYVQPDSTVHLIIPAYNEGNVIEDKIRNSYSIEYPCIFKVYVIIDKSSDDTFTKAMALISDYPDLVVIDKGYRKGKNDSLNYLIKMVKPKPYDVLFFTDANSFFQKDSFLELWKEFKAGAVVVGGSMMYIDMATGSSKSEGVYWRYEEWIRNNEGKMGRSIAMNGGNIAMIAGFYTELPLFVPNDFDIPISFVSDYRTAFCSSSVAIEKAILCKSEELRRKERMANRQMNAILLRWEKLSTTTKLQLFFHKIIRWLAFPIALVITLLSVFQSLFNGGMTILLLCFAVGWLCVMLFVTLSSIWKGRG